ncbi:MAG: DUF4956 domain-containing protein [Actinomycetota bacterium]|nr:DUF4956 domain-containing protein [Actinomycetota bacterium]
MGRITFSKVIESLGLDGITQINQSLNIWLIIINLTFALIIVLFIYFIYKITFSGVLYSKNFNITLILVSLITASAVIVISSNLVLSLGMVGALSIVRFRMAVKDPKDVGFLFWAITNGIICGAGAYNLAVVSAVFIGLVVFILSKKVKFVEPYLLIIDSKELDMEKIEDILKKNTMLYKVRSKIIEKDKSQFIVEIKIKKDKIQDLLKVIKELNDLTSVKLVSYEGDLEEG